MAITSADAVARVNAYRAANGIPGDLVEDPALTEGCRQFVHYAALNGGFDKGRPHGETPGNPGYTPAGDEAAQSSVLAGGSSWSDPHTWATAPYHEYQVMNPRLLRTGYAEEGGYQCLQTHAKPKREIRASDFSIYTVPGPGATGVRPAETAYENDSNGAVRVPGDDVGLPAGTTTGPNIIVYAVTYPLGNTQVESASLEGPDGPVDVARTADFVIPRRPLKPSTTYTAHVAIRLESRTCTVRATPQDTSPDEDYCADSIPLGCLPADLADLEPDSPFRLCGAGETPPPDPYPLPERVVEHSWTFTTAAGAPGSSGDASRPCRPTLRGPRKVASGARLRVSFRACGAATVTAGVYRGRQSKPLVRRAMRVRRAAASSLVLSGAKLRPGRYTLRASVGGRPAKSISQKLTVAAAR
jgi:hypothetical protein